MEFSINIVMDGQKATISIAGLNKLNNHANEVKEKLNEALSLALGIDSPKESCFEKEEMPLPEGYLPPIEKQTIVYEKQTIKENEKIAGAISNIDNVVITGDLGHQTLVAKKVNENQQQITENIKQRTEKEIILELYVASSENKDKTYIIELKNELKQVREKRKEIHNK